MKKQRIAKKPESHRQEQTEDTDESLSAHFDNQSESYIPRDKIMKTTNHFNQEESNT